MKVNYMITLLILLYLQIPISCSNPAGEDGHHSIRLEAIDATLIHVWIKITIEPHLVGKKIRIYRDDKDIETIYDMNKTDTTLDIYEFPTYPGTEYQFHAILEGDKDYISNRIVATTLTPGPTEISWQVDTVGIWQTSLNGVWGSSPQDVYVVGYINVPERELPYNVMHWNGQQWKLIDYVEGEPNEAFGFGPDDVWLVGDGGGHNALIAYWNGSKWQTWEFSQYGNLTGLWGTSSQNLYAVGLEGLILHYDGITWTKMSSGTTIPLRDIHGIGDKIYVIGGSFSGTEGILLQLINKKWVTIYNGTLPDSLGGYGSTVWCANPFYTYMYLTPFMYIRIRDFFNPGFDTYHVSINKIRGTGYTNIFAVGDYGSIIHFNGQDEKREPFYSIPNGDTMNDVMVFDNAVFVVGYSSGLGTIYRGIY